MTTTCLVVGALFGTGCATGGSVPIERHELRLVAATECRNRFPNTVASVEIDRSDQLRWTPHRKAPRSERRAFMQCYYERLKDLPHVATIAWPDSPPSPAEAAFAEAPTWQPGDQWRFRWSGRRGVETLVWTMHREETVDADAYYVTTGNRREQYWKKSDLSLAMEKERGEVVARHVPPQLWYVWPLRPGTEWEFEWTQPGRTLTSRPVVVCRAEDIETLPVAAGAFDAVRVTCHRKSTNDVVVERWYAPAVKTDVRRREYRRDGVEEFELLEYRPARP